MKTGTVSVEKLGKRYQLGDRVHFGRVSEAIVRVASAPQRLFMRQAPSDEGVRYKWALRDATFEIEQGEVIGFVGPNGAGKSTLLKLLSRVTEPTEGRATLHGRVGSLLEVGTGFHPELTGRENVYLSGAILGMRRAEIRRKFDEIVSFAEVGDYIDTPVKRYSSGMQVRLGFAVAAHLESEILIVDEVLAVGDAAFQRRCLGKLEDVAHGGGRTVLFVSHNLQAVHGLCDRAVHLDSGRVVEIADATTVVQSYLERRAGTAPEKTWAEADRPGDDVVRLVATRVMSPDGRLLPTAAADTPIVVEIEVDVRAGERVVVGFDLETEDGGVVFTSFLPEDGGPILAPGRNVLHAEIPPGLLNGGRFMIGPRASRQGLGPVFHASGSVQFEVIAASTDVLYGLKRQGGVAPSLGWRLAG